TLALTVLVNLIVYHEGINIFISVLPYAHPCRPNPCGSYATCTARGSRYTCKCNSGYVGNGRICVRPPTCGTGYRWSRFFNRDRPSGNCDCENHSLLRQSYPNEVCRNPRDVDVVDASTNLDYRVYGQVVTIKTPQEKAFTCYNRQQKRGQKCRNYKVRFCCGKYLGGLLICFVLVIYNYFYSDVNECDRPNICGSNKRCVNTPGSYRCICNQGYSLVDGQCVDIDECNRRPRVCDGKERCVNTQGSYRCVCKPGYEKIRGRCVAIMSYGVRFKTKVVVRHVCLCADGHSNFSCQCNHGFTGDGQSYVYINECSSSPCDGNARCTNTPGSFRCQCNRGFTGNGLTCTALNPCSPNPCGSNAVCRNVHYRAVCSCLPGFNGNPLVGCSGKTNNRFLIVISLTFKFNLPTFPDINECNAPVKPCHSNAQCTNTVGSFTCACNTGHTGDGQACADIDECLNPSACHAQAACTNSPGSFSCQCNNGFTGDGQSSSNPCLPNPCGSNAVCHNVHYRAVCSCLPGFGGDPLVECPGNTINQNDFLIVICLTFKFNLPTFPDINECNAPVKPCHSNAQCTNTVGSFTCACNTGYAGDGQACADINECSNPSACHAQATCTNSPGSFCQCNNGFTGDGQSCVPLNPCLPNPCGSNAVCRNVHYRAVCSCLPGFGGDPFIGCSALNPCSPSPCGRNAVCRNVHNRAVCTCPLGFVGNPFVICNSKLSELSGNETTCLVGALNKNTRAINTHTHTHIKATGSASISNNICRKHPIKHSLFIRIVACISCPICEKNFSVNGINRHLDICTGLASCRGFCGSHVPKTHPCGCDSSCYRYNNCCDDYRQLCT
uniref:Uncharacterized protein n=1 Tax=Ciona savignyi TaxID=51511 RepID=H2YFF2_CIOSA